MPFVCDRSFAVPAAGVVAPPPVNSTGALGSSTDYARADHTHVSSVWAGQVATDASGNATFNFPAGFFSAAPVISADIENTSPITLYNRAVTVHTATQVVISVRSVAIALGLLNFTAPAAGLLVNLIARKASA